MIDLRIIYKRGKKIAFIRPMTAQGRNWLSDHVKGRRVNNSAMVETEELLPLIAKMQAAELVIYWDQ